MLKIVTVALALLAGAMTHANAQTIGYAQAIDILAKSCGGDIQKYCSNATLANFAINDCLAQNRAKLSNQCATDIAQVRQSLEARASAQASAEKVCATDIRRLCPMTKPGRGHILNCLIKAERSASKACNTAITNAGWR